jgi:hypothetical protein
MEPSSNFNLNISKLHGKLPDDLDIHKLVKEKTQKQEEQPKAKSSFFGRIFSKGAVSSATTTLDSTQAKKEFLVQKFNELLISPMRLKLLNPEEKIQLIQNISLIQSLYQDETDDKLLDQLDRVRDCVKSSLGIGMAKSIRNYTQNYKARIEEFQGKAKDSQKVKSKSETPQSVDSLDAFIAEFEMQTAKEIELIDSAKFSDPHETREVTETLQVYLKFGVSEPKTVEYLKTNISSMLNTLQTLKKPIREEVLMCSQLLSAKSLGLKREVPYESIKGYSYFEKHSQELKEIFERKPSDTILNELREICKKAGGLPLKEIEAYFLQNKELIDQIPGGFPLVEFEKVISELQLEIFKNVPPDRLITVNQPPPEPPLLMLERKHIIESLAAQFDAVLRKFPFKPLDMRAQSTEKVSLRRSVDVAKAREMYSSFKSNSAVLKQSLPTNYPVTIPNLLSATSKPMQVHNQEEFLSVMQAYTAYREKLETLEKKLSGEIVSLGKIQEKVNEIEKKMG